MDRVVEAFYEDRVDSVCAAIAACGVQQGHGYQGVVLDDDPVA
jgi:hypothetical protein